MISVAKKTHSFLLRAPCGRANRGCRCNANEAVVRKGEWRVWIKGRIYIGGVLGRLIIGDTCIRGTLIFLVLYGYIRFSKQPCLTTHALFMATPFKGPVSCRMPRFNNAVKCLASILIKYFKLLTYGSSRNRMIQCINAHSTQRHSPCTCCMVLTREFSPLLRVSVSIYL
jgi:hypothetical protein